MGLVDSAMPRKRSPPPPPTCSTGPGGSRSASIWLKWLYSSDGTQALADQILRGQFVGSQSSFPPTSRLPPLYFFAQPKRLQSFRPSHAGSPCLYQSVRHSPLPITRHWYTFWLIHPFSIDSYIARFVGRPVFPLAMRSSVCPPN
ncbi:unnamed protein product [Protopolystoma xenopodis]|uniref:Uncharacterized protein n=1 Tax=Protopolystoma xenopodis TaxID=117903 RepID=A0A448X078_9PLAT|nr:unnamed protein product [Protopolystoma xenopodis]